jgi:hypothetical protein
MTVLKEAQRESDLHDAADRLAHKVAARVADYSGALLLSTYSTLPVRCSRCI